MRYVDPNPYAYLLMERLITPSGAEILRYVYALTRDGGTCAATNGVISATMGMSPKTVANELTKLSDPLRDWGWFGYPPLVKVKRNRRRLLELAEWGDWPERGRTAAAYAEPAQIAEPVFD